MLLKACTARGFCESEPICLVGFCHPNPPAWSPRGTGPTFPPFQPQFPWLCGFHLPSQEPGEAHSETRTMLQPLPGCPGSSCPRIKVSPLSGGWWWGRVTHQPRAQIWILLLFSPFCMGDRERRRREKPLKNVSCSIAQQFTSLLSPVTLPWCTS